MGLYLLTKQTEWQGNASQHTPRHCPNWWLRPSGSRVIHHNYVPLWRLSKSFIPQLSRTVDEHSSHTSLPVMARLNTWNNPHSGANQNYLMTHFSVSKHTRNGSSVKREKQTLLYLGNEAQPTGWCQQSVPSARNASWPCGPWGGFLSWQFTAAARPQEQLPNNFEKVLHSPYLMFYLQNFLTLFHSTSL